MKPTRRVPTYVSTIVLTVLVSLGATQLAFDQVASAQGQRVQAPVFQVDATWPKPLPNHWVLGGVSGVAVDAQDHIWIVHRPGSLSNFEKAAALTPPTAECCVPAPAVLEFDQAGSLLRHWGGPGPGYEWPQSEHGIYVDYKGNIWLGGSGRMDAHVLKFTKDGKFLMQIGHQGKNGGSNDTENLGVPAGIQVDPSSNEVYIADGYGNHRVIVFDADSGAYKRHWGAYGKRPDDTGLPYFGEKGWPGNHDPSAPPARQFNIVHCIALSNDGLVYVCDRVNDRLQVFKKDGTFVNEMMLSPQTLGNGSAWAIGFSHDAQQRFLYFADGQNQRVNILQRDTLNILNTFGNGGRQAGSFFGVHSLAVDSKGNIYTGETVEGKRLQRFLYKAPVARGTSQ